MASASKDASSSKPQAQPVAEGDDKIRLTEAEKKQNHIASGTFGPRNA